MTARFPSPTGRGLLPEILRASRTAPTALILRATAGPPGRKRAIRSQEFEACDLIQTVFGETQFAETDRAIGLDHENRRDELQTIGGGYRIGIFVYQKVKRNAESLLEGARSGGLFL